MDQLAGGPLNDAGRRFVVREVDLEVQPRQVVSRLATVEVLVETDPKIVAGTFADGQHVARGAANLFDQSGGGGPVGVVERGLMQRRKDAIEGFQWVHDTSFPGLSFDSASPR
ncbi:MAG: hypothetical protein OXG74_14535 [Acidobacteria bacterium]|nr:hypothetical protein [Acidobacteriota bacterium]